MRDLVKTMTFAALHFTVGFGVTYALTGSISIATGVALIEPAINTVVFYFHEKAWGRTPRLSMACDHPRGAAARFKRSLIAKPKPSSDTGATAMPAYWSG